MILNVQNESSKNKSLPYSTSNEASQVNIWGVPSQKGWEPLVLQVNIISLMDR